MRSIWNEIEHVKKKDNFVPALKYHARKTYAGVKVKLHAFSASVLPTLSFVHFTPDSGILQRCINC
jgi:hypothetical protein